MKNIDALISNYIKEYAEKNNKKPQYIYLPIGIYNLLTVTPAFKLQNLHLNVKKPFTYDGVQVLPNDGEMWVTK